MTTPTDPTPAPVDLGLSVPTVVDTVLALTRDLVDGRCPAALLTVSAAGVANFYRTDGCSGLTLAAYFEGIAEQLRDEARDLALAL